MTNPGRKGGLPECSDSLAELPVLLGAEGTIDGDLDNWNVAQFFAKHESEGHEDTVIETCGRATEAVLPARFEGGGRSGEKSSLS